MILRRVPLEESKVYQTSFANECFGLRKLCPDSAHLAIISKINLFEVASGDL